MKANDVLYGLGGTVRKKAEAYLAEQKGQLDTETRRKVRVFWVRSEERRVGKECA